MGFICAVALAFMCSNLFMFSTVAQTCNPSQGIILGANSTFVTEHQALQLTCTLDNDASYVSWYRNDFQAVIASVGIIDGNCLSDPNMSASAEYSYSCVNGRTYMWTMHDVTRHNHGDKWRCSGSVGGFLIYSNCVELHVEVSGAHGVKLQMNEDVVNQYSPAKMIATVGVTKQTTLHRVSWLKEGSVTAHILLPNCNAHTAPAVDRTLYDFSCDMTQTIFTWTIKNVTKNNHGEVWSCQVLTDDASAGDNGLLISNNLLLDILVTITSVTMTNYTTEHTVIENGTVQLHCLTSGGLPRATVRWYRLLNGGPTCDTSDEITATVSVTITTVDGLNITSSTIQYTTSRNDNGIGICCSASNMVDQELTSRITKLNVQYPPPNRPVITGFNGNSDFFMVENTLANLTCSVTGGNPLTNLTWSCYGKNGISQTITDETVSRTVVWTASRGEEGQCRCISNHVTGQTQDVAVNVKVLYPPSQPTLTVKSKEVLVVHLTEGNSLTVSCNSSSVPAPDTYTWILPTGTTRSGQLLHIDNIQYHYNLVYTCIAGNHMDPSKGQTVVGMRSAPLSIVLSFAPRHAHSDQRIEDVVVTTGQMTDLSITLAAYPIPYLHIWSRCKSGVCSDIYNDANIVTSTVGLTSNLTIMSTKQEDFGQYRLTVSNGIGRPYNYTFRLRKTVLVDAGSDSTNTNTAALISGVVGGVVALAVIVAATVVIIVCLTRRKVRDKCERNDALNKSSKKKVNYDDVKQLTPTEQSHPGRNDGAGISTAEPTAQSEYIGLSQYGNVQNPYEELGNVTGAGIESQTGTDKTYTNIIS